MTLTTFILTALAQGLALSAAMMMAWVIQQRTGNSGWIDAVWTFALGTVGVASALLPVSEQAASLRQLAVAALIALWSLRLGLHIVQRSANRPDDPRYAELVRGWGPNARRRMFVLLQNQALVSLPLALSIFVAAQNPTPELRPQDAFALVLIVAAIAGEALSDRQLREFSANPANNGRICDQGLWRWSRHPNYFFEWLQWTAYPLLAIDLSGDYPWGWLALMAPACMYWLLAYVSGIPPLEEHMVRRYGAAYRAYQARTNAFFPAPPHPDDRTVHP